MAKKKYRIFYLSSLALLLALSAYPLYMGIKVISQFLHRGSVVATDYPKYVIPYTPVCLALLLVAAIFSPALRPAEKVVPRHRLHFRRRRVFHHGNRL